jgi:hypothetical protein
VANNKIVRIPKRDLVVDANTQEYVIRYRVVSENKNRFSAWSSAYRLPAPTIDQILLANGLLGPGGERLVDSPVYTPRTISTPSGEVKVFNVFWNAPEVLNEDERRGYDLYIKWGNYDAGTGLIVYDGDYEYTKRVSAASLNYTRPSEKSSYDRISLWVQSETYPKKIVFDQRLYSIEDQEL